MSKRQKAFSNRIYQPPQKANCFLDYIHLNENRQFSQRTLLAKQSFAVEILEFRLSIIVMLGIRQILMFHVKHSIITNAAGINIADIRSFRNIQRTSGSSDKIS